jgi:transglutaminase-like putative cysteine protease
MPTYQLTHATTYQYDKPVTVSWGRAHLVPGDVAGQHCVQATLDIDPIPAESGTHEDYFGNHSTFFCVRHPHTTLSVTARSTIEVCRQAPSMDRLNELTWEQVREAVAVNPVMTEFVLPSPRVRPAREIDTYARSIFTAKRPLGDALADLDRRIYRDFEYKSGATTVNTTTAQLLRKRAGVCQDFAHLGLACLRSVGLAARYVSGYLETQPPPGQVKLQGADASHAWIATYVPALGWVDLDPTNNQFVDDRYLVVAQGRDYGDVPPLKGVIVTESGKSTMDVGVDVVRVG